MNNATMLNIRGVFLSGTRDPGEYQPFEVLPWMELQTVPYGNT